MKTGLWKKTSAKGNSYYSGKIEINGVIYSIALFKNEKQNEKQPDLRMLVEEVKEQVKANPLNDEVFKQFGDGIVDNKTPFDFSDGSDLAF